MQIVIDIPEEVKHKVYAYGLSLCPSDKEQLINAIKNGTILPKGHGDLIDISKLPVTITYFGISDKPREVVNYNCILNAKKIIKADKIESENKE